MHRHRSIALILCLFGLLAVSHSSAHAQQKLPADPSLSYLSAGKLTAEPPPMCPSNAVVISNFIAAENKFREALTQFSFKRDVRLQTIGAHGEVTGEYIRNSVFELD